MFQIQVLTASLDCAYHCLQPHHHEASDNYWLQTFLRCSNILLNCEWARAVHVLPCFGCGLSPLGHVSNHELYSCHDMYQMLCTFSKIALQPKVLCIRHLHVLLLLTLPLFSATCWLGVDRFDGVMHPGCVSMLQNLMSSMVACPCHANMLCTIAVLV